MTEYVYKLKNGKVVSAYADEEGNISMTKEALEIMANSWNDGYQKGYQAGGSDMEKAKQIIIDELLKQIEQIRAEIFNEIMPILIDIVDKEGYCYGYDQEIDRLEWEWKQLKEQ